MGVNTSPLHTLHFVVFKNVARIYLNQGKDAEALIYFKKAADVDDLDVSLWDQIGKLAFKVKDYRTSLWAFFKGKDVSYWT